MNSDEELKNIETVRIKLSSKLDKKAPIFLAEFAPGRLNDNCKMEFKSYKSKEDSNMDNRMASRLFTADNNSITHSGLSEDTKLKHRTFVGVLNKKSGKMKLHDAVFFKMKPNLQPVIHEKTNDAIPANDYWKKRNILTAAFGGKAKQRTLNERLKYTVSSDSLDNIIDTDPSTSKATLPILSSESCGTISYLPPINRDASYITEVFDINDIISPEEDITLQENAETFLRNLLSDSKSVDKGNFCKFVLSRIETEDDITKIKYLLYYNYLVMFHQLSYADIRKKDPAPHIPEPFKRKMINNFTVLSKSQSGNQSKTFPPQKRDKLTAYILVLSLFIDNYCVDMDQIIGDLKRVGMRQFNLIAQSLGCHITNRKIDGNTIKRVELKLPLSVMPSKFSKRQF